MKPMKAVNYIVRLILMLLFIYAGIEKLFLPYNPSVFKADTAVADPHFFAFYDLLQRTGYLYFVGFFQLLCGVLVAFRRTYLLGAVMLVPLILCLLMVHVFVSRYPFYIAFDGTLLLMTVVLVMQNYKLLKATFLKPQNKWI